MACILGYFLLPRKLAADRAVELESPALRTYVSANPDADMALLKFMDELKTRSDLAARNEPYLTKRGQVSRRAAAGNRTRSYGGTG